MTIGLASAFGEFAADDLGQENAVVAGVDVADRFAFQVAERIVENRHAAGAVRDRQALECRLAGLEALAEVLQKFLLPFADQVQHERLALGEPIAHVAAELHGDADHRRLEAGLHHPAREHAGRARAGADGENEDAARHAAEDGVEGFGMLIDFARDR